MKTYPTIDSKIRDGKYYIFDKLDGSNIRAEWSSKKGFYKFGTRRRLLDPKEEPFGRAIPLILDIEEEASAIFKKHKIQSAVMFFEFYGENSNFGRHNLLDSFRVDLIDVSVYKKGILNPKDFLEMFGSIPHAKLLHYGNITSDILEQIRNGTLEGMTFEGVICKAKYKNRDSNPTMFKIKNLEWYLKLREYCSGDEKLFEKLH